tara:strand:+ start:910 stop:1329 length:420 start_codon:yes stop_codon:yes gene_type:complete
MKNLLIAVTLVLTSFAASASSFVESNSLNGFRLQITINSTNDYWVEFNFGNDLCLKGDKNDALPLGTRIINGTKIHFDTNCSYNIDGQVVVYPSTGAGIEKLVEIVKNSDVLKWESPRGVAVFDLKDLDKSFLKFRGGI